MAIASIITTQDNAYLGITTFGVDSPLRFVAKVYDDGAAPYSFPDYLNVSLLETGSGETYSGYKALQWKKEGAYCYYIFYAEKIVKSLMGIYSKIDDPPQSIELDTMLNILEFRLRFNTGSINQDLYFFAYRCARQIGQREALIELVRNYDEDVIAFANRSFYLHYMLKNNTAIIFDGTSGNGGGVVRKIKSISTIGASKAYVYYVYEVVFSPIYGYLYNKSAAYDSRLISYEMQSVGWRLPSLSDIETLIAYVGAGNIGKLMLCRQVNSTITACNTSTHPRWNESLAVRSNETGLGISPGGYRSVDGSFQQIGEVASIGLTSNTIARFFNTEYEDDIYLNKVAVGIRLIRSATSEELLLPDGKLDKKYYDGNDGKKYACVKIGSQLYTFNLCETKFSDDSDIPIVTGVDSWISLGDSDPAMCLYNNDSAYLGANTDDYVLGKTFNITTLPDRPCGLYVKFLDSKTGYYRHWLFDRYYKIEGDHSAVGTVEKFTTTLMESNETSAGRKIKEKILASSDELTQAEMNYIEGLFYSPRIYVEQDGVWIEVSIEDGTAPIRFRKFNTESVSITFVKPQSNTISMI